MLTTDPEDAPIESEKDIELATKHAANAEGAKDASLVHA